MIERACMLAVALAALLGFHQLGSGFETAIASAGASATSTGRHVSSGMTVARQAGIEVFRPVAKLLEQSRDAGTAVRQSAAARASFYGLAIRHPGSALGEMVLGKRYFYLRDFAALHVKGAGYHDTVHSAEVSAVAHALAEARGLPAAKALFLSQVGLVHDIDPLRAYGIKPRVSATLDLLGNLSSTMGWDARHEAMARAVIQRTVFPFEGAEVEKYEALVRVLDPRDQRFVLREAPMLSEYADKASNYFLRGPRITARKVMALTTETDPTGKLRPQDLSTGDFLGSIGSRAAFAADRAVAERVLGEGRSVRILSRAQIARLRPEWMAQLDLNRELLTLHFPRE